MSEPLLSPSSSQVFRLPRFNPWEELAYLSMFIMELSWIISGYLLLAAPSGLADLWISFLAFGGILATALLLLRLLEALDIKKSFRRWAFSLLILLSLLTGLKLLVYFHEKMTLDLIIHSALDALNTSDPRLQSIFPVILLIIVTSYRGTVLAGEEAVPSAVGHSLRLGLVLLGLQGLYAAITIKTIPGALGFLLVFLFAGLLGMTAARIFIGAQSRGGQRLPFERQRVMGLIIAILGLVLLAGLAALLVSSSWGLRLLMYLVGLAGLLLQWLIIAIGILLSPIYFVILLAVQWIVNRLLPLLKNISSNPQQNDLLTNLQELASQQPVLAVDYPLLNRLVLGGLILTAVVVITLLIRFRSNRGRPAGLGETESLLSQADLLKQMGQSARNMLNELAQRLGLRQAARRFAAQRIRAIYIDLLDLADRLKYPRRLQQTPLEYLPELQNAFPGSRQELALITQAYLRVRYGELPETLAEVNSIESAWRQVQLEGQSQLHPPSTLSGRKGDHSV
jgi:hypothetical protein